MTIKKKVQSASSVVKEYQQIETALYGGMHFKASELWSYLFAIQSDNQVSGDLMEIGVFRGWGSYLPAKFRNHNELIILVDIISHHLELSRDFLIQSCKVPESSIKCYQADTVKSQLNDSLVEHQDRSRWIHIDGEHSYPAVFHDLNIAARMALPEAIICVDDVDHPLASCINDALLDWLRLNGEWSLLIRGFNKAYLSSSRSQISWADYIKILPEVFERYYDSRIMLASQTHNSQSSYYCYGERIKSDKYLKVNKAVGGTPGFFGVSPSCYLIGERQKPSILLFGNCQMRILHIALTAAASVCGLDVSFEYVQDVHELTDEGRLRLRGLASESELLITQIVTGDRYGICTEDLVLCATDRPVVKVPSMHFNAYWPNHADLQMIEGSSHCMPVDSIIYKLVLASKSYEYIRDVLEQPSLYSQQQVQEWYSAAINRLKQREEAQGLDLRLSEYLEASGKRERLFYIFNHPGKKVFDYILGKVLVHVSNLFSAKDHALLTRLAEGSTSINYDMSMIDFVDIPPLRSVGVALGLGATSDTASRFFRERGSHAIHKAVTLENEIRLIREQISKLAVDQLDFNDKAIATNASFPINVLD